jgi:hypothetical protein
MYILMEVADINMLDKAQLYHVMLHQVPRLEVLLPERLEEQESRKGNNFF